MTTVVHCPTCGKKVEWKPESRFRPFCSARCKQIDLGAWATGKYTIGSDDRPADESHSDPQKPGELN
ncbi:DNA gyrase inhibitor YacG [Mycetohabitans sp. B8]|uniref:DNA gyrase inhibitor YacG n=1 Tax=Mycetohabitans sp. B8 TaxID=2841845 RepID=UPI001F277A56|nr:DNA gyrase inhibitor YacG [Mycetohabitans sp. B8]MCG1041359.1 DNA gyrase inhibitor YacG [Mycetohabitans sp. B8]